MENLNVIWKAGDSTLIMKKTRDTLMSLDIFDDNKIHQMMIHDLAGHYESLLEAYTQLKKDYDELLKRVGK